MRTSSVLETERLVLRSMVSDDLERLSKIFGDAVVMAAFDEAPFNREQVRRWLEHNLDHQRKHGYGLFAVCLKDDGRLIGDCGLELMDVAGEQVAELGYDFRSDHWNQGYATEAACAVRDYAFTSLRLPRLVSLIRPGNPASARVAEKTGLKKIEHIQRDGRTYLRYGSENTTRKQRRPESIATTHPASRINSREIQARNELRGSSTPPSWGRPPPLQIAG